MTLQVVESEMGRIPRGLRTQALKQQLWSVVYMPQVVILFLPPLSPQPKALKQQL